MIRSGDRSFKPLLISCDNDKKKEYICITNMHHLSFSSHTLLHFFPRKVNHMARLQSLHPFLEITAGMRRRGFG